MTQTADCLFCRIAAGEIPADFVRRTEDTVAFKDIAPQAPTHIVVIPRKHYRNIAELASSDPALGGRYTADVAKVVSDLGVADFRLVFNTGASAGQSVFHVHAHVLAGRDFGWPPG